MRRWVQILGLAAGTACAPPDDPARGAGGPADWGVQAAEHASASLGWTPTLTSTDEVTVHRVQPCAWDLDDEPGTETLADLPCWFVNLSVQAAGAGGEVPLYAVLRTPEASALLGSRWVTFEPPSTGSLPSAPPGRPGGDSAHGDLVQWHNQAGYTTLELGWDCPQKRQGEPHCSTLPATVEDWMSPTEGAETHWGAALEGTGYAGAARRVAAVNRWAADNSGRTLCAQGFSGGTGRLAGVITRDDGDLLFDTVVLSGGPVWSFIPWSCGVGTGAFPLDERWDDASPGPLTANYDETRSCSDPALCPEEFSHCSDGRFHPVMLMDSFQYRPDRDDLRLDLAVVMGGRDRSTAWKSVLQYLSDLAPVEETLWGWTEDPDHGQGGIHLRQGYCETQGDTYLACSAGDVACPQASCRNWATDAFPGVHGDLLSTYAPELAEVGHSVSTDPLGARVLLDALIATCEP